MFLDKYTNMLGILTYVQHLGKTRDLEWGRCSTNAISAPCPSLSMISCHTKLFKDRNFQCFRIKIRSWPSRPFLQVSAFGCHPSLLLPLLCQLQGLACPISHGWASEHDWAVPRWAVFSVTALVLVSRALTPLLVFHQKPRDTGPRPETTTDGTLGFTCPPLPHGRFGLDQLS